MKLKLLVSAIALLIGMWQIPSYGAASTASNADSLDYASAKSRADSGDIDAMLRLADIYANGEGVKPDASKSFKLHRKAAEMGSARGQCLLGLDYADGLGTKKDSGLAIKYLRMSADQGWPSAQFDLALCYAVGTVPGKGATDALIWYRKAADQGLPDAEWALGNAYLEGIGAPKDIPEGVLWMKKSAEKGFPLAQKTLGICYTKGTGVPKDFVQAYKWLNLAASKDDRNSDDIRVNLSMAERFMTPEQIAEGQRLAHEFKAQKITAPGHTTPTETATPSHGTNSPSVTTNTASVASAPATGGKIGFVMVKGDDEAAEVFSDGEFVGNIPAKLKLPEGTHLIEVKKSGFKDYQKKIKVGDSAELTLKVVLEKQ